MILNPAFVTHLLPHASFKQLRQEAWGFFNGILKYDGRSRNMRRYWRLIRSADMISFNLPYSGKDVDRLNAYKSSHVNVIWLERDYTNLVEPHCGDLIIVPVVSGW